MLERNTTSTAVGGYVVDDLVEFALLLVKVVPLILNESLYVISTPPWSTVVFSLKVLFSILTEDPDVVTTPPN